MRIGTVRTILFIVIGSVFLVSSAVVLKHHSEMRTGTTHTEAVTQMVVTPVPEPSDDESAEQTPAEATIAVPIQVDFDTLCAQNQDIIGWLYCPNTPINYPVVQATDNEYYLHRLLDDRNNSGGTLFVDYRNSSDLSDWNSIIYGHNMINDSMFGSLTDYKAQSYFDAHPEIFLLTPERNYVINLFAGYTTPADSELYNIFDPSAEEQTGFVQDWLDRSDFTSETIPAPEDRFITLSTCSYEYNDARYVLIGILNELT